MLAECALMIHTCEVIRSVRPVYQNSGVAKMTSHLTSANLVTRVIWAYAIYIVLVLISFVVGYFLLPRGAFINTPWTAFGVMAANPDTFMGQFLATVGFNLGFVFLVGVGLNLQKVNGFPTGYIFVFSAGIISGLIAGTNSFVSQAISPYTIEGWLIALRIQHIELLGYTIIVASTISIGLWDYNSWLPWKAKERKIQGWRDIRLTKQEIAGVFFGVLLILFGAYNETVIAL